MTYAVKSFSSFNNWTFSSDTPNVSNIIDKLIRITAKITERFAGDIMFTLSTFEDAVDTGNPYDICLAFRENGVNEYPVREDGTVECECFHAIQVWRLRFDPEKILTVLERVYLAGNNIYVGM